ncbi:hypothetical protein ARAM_002187 [Aspergillus rambellii]|uniref:Serine peptidase, family S28 n=1 Tax=Aspergillus rambellii TaxID=308745 RepID=A0A0F8VT41_9EURO|nr:hypothetical protein ARAM_002187 [Aspergillus rambellii]
MRSFAAALATVALLSSPGAGLRLRSDFTRDLQLSAELGLDPDLLLKNRHVLHTLLEQPSTIPAEYVPIPIDHEDPHVVLYSGRPVFLYDAGESSAEPSLVHLTSETSFFNSMIQEFNAIGILWEHRYYGQSLPYPVTNTTPPEQMKYLTTRQALADIPYFARTFTRPDYPRTDLTPASTPWVMVGGSYPGIRAALARKEYPETIFAAFAASAPVQAQINMSIYFDQVYRGMVSGGLGNCVKDLHAALQYIDDQLAHPDTAKTMKQLFFGVGAEQNSNEDFGAALAGIYGYFQSHGVDGGEGGLRSLCGYLEVDPRTNESAGANGLAPAYGAQYVAERWASWPTFVEVVNSNMETNCKGLDSTTARSCVLNNPPTDADTLSWTWQYCSEWGFYQSNNVGAHSLLSRYQTLELMQRQCNEIFPEASKQGILPPQPKAAALNQEFGGWTIRPSNVYFSAGEFDPWRTLSLLSNEDFAPQGVSLTTQIPPCGVQPGADKVFGFVGANSVHCFDFRTDSAVGEESRGYFIQALKEWLPCFGK